jgi:predicted O-methyltransferase YrrM
VPHIATSALGHVQVVALFPASGSWQSMASCSQYRFSGAVFLRQESLTDPWWVAEYLLHEAVHQKLYDIRETHSLIAADSVFQAPSGELSQTGSAGLLQPPWNRRVSPRRDEWPISRVLAAVHVYVHLAVLAANEEERLSELERKYGPRRTGALGLVGSRSAFDRASFLVDALNGSLRDELGPAGVCLVSWIAQCLDLLATRPSRPRLELRLALERYEREADATQSVLDEALEGGRERDAASTTLVTGLFDQLAFECNEAHNIIDRIDGAVIETSTELETVRSGIPTSLETLGFLGVRRIVKNALGDSLTIWSTQESPAGDESRAAAVNAALRMIDASTDRLAAIVSSKPTRTDNTSTPPVREETVLDHHAGASLLELTDILGRPYGTEEFCLFLHSLIRMNRPRTIVELGTGYGCSALWMALGCKVSGSGHVWSFDDGARLDRLPDLLSDSRDRLAHTAWANLDPAAPTTMDVILARLGLESHVTFVHERMSLALGTELLTHELHEPVDLLFSDFRHDPEAITSILSYFLPRMAPDSSIFIDSASTFHPSYLLLEHLAGHVDKSALPPTLQNAAIADLKARLDDHRITLVHLTKVGRSEQNSVAWLKLEPNHVPIFSDVR